MNKLWYNKSICFSCQQIDSKKVPNRFSLSESEKRIQIFRSAVSVCPRLFFLFSVSVYPALSVIFYSYGFYKNRIFRFLIHYWKKYDFISDIFWKIKIYLLNFFRAVILHTAYIPSKPMTESKYLSQSVCRELWEGETQQQKLMGMDSGGKAETRIHLFYISLLFIRYTGTRRTGACKYVDI